MGEVLVGAQVITPAQLNAALIHQARYGKKLGEALLDLGVASPEQVLRALAVQLRVPFVREHLARVAPELVAGVPATLLRRLRVCPVRLEWPGDTPRGVLYVATSEPENLTFVDEVAFAVGHVVRPVLALKEDIDRALRQHGVLPRHDVDALELPTEDGEAFVIER